MTGNWVAVQEIHGLSLDPDSYLACGHGRTLVVLCNCSIAFSVAVFPISSVCVYIRTGHLKLCINEWR